MSFLVTRAALESDGFYAVILLVSLSQGTGRKWHMVFLRLDFIFYLRETPICWLSPQMFTTARTGLGEPSWRPKAQSRSPTQRTGSPLSEPSLLPSQYALARSWMRGPGLEIEPRYHQVGCGYVNCLAMAAPGLKG